jgi:hypothetical protein
MMHEIFQLCVDALVIVAKIFGTTYEAVNVWLFCVIAPILIVGTMIYIIILHYKISYFKGLNHKS